MSRLAAIPILLVALLSRPAPAAPIRVSSFSTILTEIAQQVGGDQVAVTGHVPPGIDPHEFEPKPADLKIVGDAQLILLTAKHLENYVAKLQEATGASGRLLEVGDGLPALHPGSAVDDPHWWQSVANVEQATTIVRDALIKIDPADEAAFTARAASYRAQLAALEIWAKAKVAQLPRDQRKLVTSHDAFQYFARDFGFTIYAVEGVSTDEQPSSREVADLIATIKSTGVKAIFLESIENPKVLTEITKETGVKVGGTLYADGLGDGDAATFAGMFRHNVATIVDALK